VKYFGWIARQSEPPSQWDLRHSDWHLCRGHDECRAECKHVLLCDVRELEPMERLGLAEADRPAWRLILLGVEEPSERARLLSIGCAEALSASTNLHELAVRAKRVDEMFGLLPRWRTLGRITLDLFHRDARKGNRWLRLHPREFGVLWRLADIPGEQVTRAQLLQDVWRINHEPGTNSVEVHVSRLRGKLAEAGCSELVQTVPEGGYRLTHDVPFMLAPKSAQADALDRYVQKLDWDYTHAS
jgi:DNA-binding winged helix-turn-helix (wHTH) protein